jgi:hypothetical protein
MPPIKCRVLLSGYPRILRGRAPELALHSLPDSYVRQNLLGLFFGHWFVDRGPGLFELPNFHPLPCLFAYVKGSNHRPPHWPSDRLAQFAVGPSVELSHAANLGTQTKSAPMVRDTNYAFGGIDVGFF